eukprot:c9423_g1_i4.p1 GENE.c9423_g1_i4~~c9423_g1_i4.p1  ORF type:complete len:230 (+),score=65.02 c9423_g1_i4:465-1154(+)
MCGVQVSYMLPDSQGTVTHEDFAGHKGVLRGGDLQWMTAGRGIVHCEMPSEKEVHGLQLWVNLSSKDKMCEPAYQELPAEKVPQVTVEGVTCRVIAGQALGITSPIYTRTPVSYLHFTMQPNSKLQQKIPSDWNAFVYILSGTATFGTNDKQGAAHTTMTFPAQQTAQGITVTASQSGVDFVMLSGQPLREPVVQHGPFVMNTQKEIEQTFDDYHEGKNGFERAHTWRV